MSETSRAARLSLLRQLLEQAKYSSQQELSDALEADGVSVSQSTLSKDLLVLGAIKRRAEDGSLVYALGGDGDWHSAAMAKLARTCSELLLSVQMAGNQIVLRTPPGAAQYFASCLDSARLPGMMGSIAGDDTVLVIATSELAASQLVSGISEMTRTGKPQQEEQQ